MSSRSRTAFSTEVARQLWQATPTAEDQGAMTPSDPARSTTAPRGPRGSAQEPGQGAERQRHHGGDRGSDLPQHICDRTEHEIPLSSPGPYDRDASSTATRPGHARDGWSKGELTRST
ncbi:hypothetical protein GCM10010344_32050 [Streptomyces bluensis]|nr:hypothetical protein GCM10010344_32050 [Streptomyces bluensis]